MINKQIQSQQTINNNINNNNNLNNNINNNNGQSFYQTLEQADHSFYIQPLMLNIDKQIDGIQKYLYPSQQLINNDKYIITEQQTKKYYTLYITNYRIIIDKLPIFSIPFGYIQDIKSFQKYLRIILKTGIYFDFYLQSNNILEEHINLAIDCVPFWYNCLANKEFPKIYDSYAEIQRMRVDSRYFNVFKNADSKFCPTYPIYFLIPKGIEASNLNQIKKCRFFGRIPVMTFYHQKTSVGIWRAAKRKQQVSADTLKYDISYIRSIPGNSIILQIQQNSTFMKSNLDFQSLQNLKLSFFNLTKQYNYCLTNNQATKIQLFKSLGKWYQQIDKILSIAYQIVDFINQSHHVILQQIYGLDRTPQVIVIAQIIMDPFFRTFDGLSILIQKQFVCFGHPFEDRGGFNKNKDSNVSPIFIQILQCIHQLTVTHPNCFQYTSSYLAKIAYQVYTTKYKNFLNRNGDPQKQKNYTRSPMSVWDEAKKYKNYRNIKYDHRTSKKQLIEIRKKPSIKQYMIWNQYFDIICKMTAE